VPFCCGPWVENKEREKLMTTLEIAKAWKDEEYRDTLTLEQCDLLPEHPSGDIEFQKSDQEAENSFGPAPVACFVLSHLSFDGCHTLRGRCK
jgi:mersacidin/lichenicidin family type 2 lantibiotic